MPPSPSESPSPVRSPSIARAARPLVFGVVAGALSFSALIAAGGVRLLLDTPVAPVMAGMLLAGAALFSTPAAAWAGVPRARVVAALGAAGVAPLLVLGALHALSDPLVASHWRCGTGEMGLLLAAPFVFGIGGTLSALLALPLAWGERRAVDAVMHRLALGALGVAAALLAWSAARAARHPAPDDYAASLPVVATVPPVAREPDAVYTREVDATPPQEVYLDRVPGFDLAIERRCTQDHCEFALSTPALDLTALTTNTNTRKYLEGGSVRRSGEIRLRRDEAHDLWVVEGTSAVAYRGPALVDVHASDVGDQLSPPRGWMVGAAGGVLLAALLQVRRRRASARMARVATATAGVLGADGWVSFDGATPAVRAAPDLGLQPGPVLILAPEGGQAPAGAYRGEAPLGAGAVLAGDRADLLGRARAELATLDAFALAALALTAAPLAAALIHLAR